jgi:poly(3-hydroxybutyrate) depolymerase
MVIEASIEWGWKRSLRMKRWAIELRVIGALILSMYCAPVRADSPRAHLGAEQTRSAFLKIIDRPKVDLAAEQREEAADAGFTRIHFTYASEAGQRVPGILLARQQLLATRGRHPVAIVLHGTGGKKESELAVLKRLAQRDLIAVSIDGRFHGERGTPADYNAAIAKAFRDGSSHPLYYDTVWDVLRLVDYLQSRSDVDPARIGLMGISKGGIETWLAAAVDPRIAVTIPCISLQSFQWGLENDGWHGRVGTVRKAFDAAAGSEGIDKPDAAFVQRFYDRLIPGIRDQFDAPKMLTLIAPRPLLAISGEKDPINPLPGVRLCEKAATAAYEKAGAANHFKLIIELNAGHTVTADAQTAAVEWFVKWLTPTGG